ncbi:WXG100-like domain-containing protein [Actinacidiphila acididurans]|uniref:WXG100 family type VII secretion target n=1 Tax=Actinacidiphila acididurans TaxID=2784346 RepID=A0ABS2TRT2_9ACTN|nr:WXG100 family type VII secretion target [Actinacidiphila acididurans]MBM9506046.1 WXG100 family type VII secretion target [Actinacidiphila acididurans]
MAIELPGPVVSFLSVVGISWPNVNEDKVREFASHLREFASAVDTTHQQATATVTQLGAHYKGASYEALLAAWGEKSTTHMTELVSLCHGVATALDVAAGVIVTMKGQCIAELIGLATAFVAEQAAAVETLGLSEAAAAATVKLAEKAVQVLEDQLTQYIIAEVIEAALDPLVEAVGKAAGGLMFKATEDALGVDTDGWDVGPGFEIHPSMLTFHATTMHGHAETVTGHATTLQTKLAGVNFQ